jgi:hypothetical protein
VLAAKLWGKANPQAVEQTAPVVSTGGWPDQLSPYDTFVRRTWHFQDTVNEQAGYAGTLSVTMGIKALVMR